MPGRNDGGTGVRSRGLFVLAALLAVLSTLAIACAATSPDGAPPTPRPAGPASPSAAASGGGVAATERASAAPQAADSSPRTHRRSLPPSPPVRLSIPAISVNTPLMRLGTRSDGTMTTPPEPFPAGWFTGSPTPGSVGPAVIAGHVTYNGPGVFFRLGQLRPGDRVRITRRDGTTVTFAVMFVREFPKDVFPTAAVYGYTAEPELRLITCSGDYDHARHHYADNLVVYARVLAAG